MSEHTEPPAFRHGVFVGFAGFVVFFQLVLATELVDMREAYRDFGTLTLPLLTRLTIHPAWLWGVPLAGAVALATLLATRPRSLVIYIAVAAALAVAAGATWYFPRAPIFALAGNIR